MFRYWLQGGYFTVGFLGGAQKTPSSGWWQTLSSIASAGGETNVTTALP
jgi:hypothetical protein